MAPRAAVMAASDSGEPPAGALAEVAIVRVEDRGIGISADAAGRVFDRFYQAGSAPVQGHVGLG